MSLRAQMVHRILPACDGDASEAGRVVDLLLGDVGDFVEEIPRNELGSDPRFVIASRIRAGSVPTVNRG